MTVIYLFMAGTLFILFVFAIQRQMKCYMGFTPVMGWLAGLFYFIILPITFIILAGEFEKPGYPRVATLWGSISTTPSYFLQPFIIIWLTLALTFLTVLFFTPNLTERHKEILRVNENQKISIEHLRRILLISIVISFVTWGINVFGLAGGLSNYFSQHWYHRNAEYAEELGRMFILYMKFSSANQMILTSATGLLILSAIKKQWQNNLGLLALAFLTLVIQMVMSGNRIYLALVFIYLILAVFSYLGPKSLIKLFLLLSPIIPIFSIWAYVRANVANLSAALQNYASIINTNSSQIMTTLIDLTEGSDSMILIKVIRDFGGLSPLLYGKTYLRAFTWILPSNILSHGESFSITLARLYQPGIPSSMNSTALGEMWANFGYFSILGLPLFTLLLMRIGHYFFFANNRMAFLSSTMFVTLIWMARSVLADNFQILVISFLVIWILGYEKNLYYLPEDDEIHLTSGSGVEQTMPS